MRNALGGRNYYEILHVCIMVTDKVLSSEGNVKLRQITLCDCTDEYVDWLNDPQVNQYLETRWCKQDIESVRGFVKTQIDSCNSLLLAIVDEQENKHIGNIKIGPVNTHHHHADISYFIGDKKMWGRGIATAAIRLACKCGFDELGLHKIEAGAYKEAIASWKALEKNGFKREATLREHMLCGDGYTDVYRYGLLLDEFYSGIGKME